MSQSIVTALNTVVDEPVSFRTSQLQNQFGNPLSSTVLWEETGKFMVEINLFCAKHIENFI